MTSMAETVAVKSAELEITEDVLQLTAQFDFSLNATLIDALKRGVSLYFVYEFELVRPRWYWLDQPVISAHRQFKVSYNALTRQYRVGSGTLYQSFDSMDEVMALLRRQRNWQVAERPLLVKETPYEAAVRMKLDVSLLPKPFQVTVIASREWQLASEWHRWKFVTP